MMRNYTIVETLTSFAVKTNFTFISPPQFVTIKFGFATLRLAHMLDSLVRVSRRVMDDHLASITNEHVVRVD